jgi:hypothetical protein
LPECPLLLTIKGTFLVLFITQVAPYRVPRG